MDEKEIKEELEAESCTMFMGRRFNTVNMSILSKLICKVHISRVNNRVRVIMEMWYCQKMDRHIDQWNRIKPNPNPNPKQI